jgi:hypothetical protein
VPQPSAIAAKSTSTESCTCAAPPRRCSPERMLQTHLAAMSARHPALPRRWLRPGSPAAATVSSSCPGLPGSSAIHCSEKAISPLPPALHCLLPAARRRNDASCRLRARAPVAGACGPTGPGLGRRRQRQPWGIVVGPGRLVAVSRIVDLSQPSLQSGAVTYCSCFNRQSHAHLTGASHVAPFDTFD